jgi:cell division protein YceG involved in septum cleavage
VNYSVYINYGQTGDQIADVLISVGLIKDRQEFYSAVAAAGAEGKLQAGNFIIPSDATPAEVVSIITN